MEILKQNLSIFFYLGRIGSMYMLNRVWVFCWRFLQHLLLKWSLWGEWSGRFYKRKTDNIIFERLIPSNEGISSAELDQNVLCILITLLPPPPKKKNKQTNKQKKISVFKNGIIECATVSHSAGLFGFLEILFWLYLDPLCLSWILRQAFYGAFGFFKDRKCGGVPKVFNFKFLIPCVHASEITNRTFLISPVFYSISVNMVKIE